MKYIISNDGTVNAFVGGKPYTFNKSHHNYGALVAYLENGNVEHFEASYDMASTVEHYCDGYVHVEKGELTWQGVPMPDLFTDRILQMRKEGFNIDPMLNFLDNMNDNPSDKAIVELFDFMQNKHLPITDDGHFLAYKAVSPDFKDIYTGNFDNSVGSEVSIDRSKVDSNRDKHCSAGLHVGAIDYVKSYGGIDLDEDNDGGNQIVICKVNPADVVSVPSDARFQKLRCCKYEVVSLFNDIFQTSVHMTDAGLKKVARTETWKHEIAYKLENVSQVLKRAKVCVA
jgi:hypothetical protein|tara:strand:+ start:132 stop:986 length:855 start_codon:yes stop_codon:yes gene_type:complete